MAQDPSRSTGRVRARLREARHLHSAERRLVADGVFDLVRWQGIFGRLGLSDPGARWDAWVGWQSGESQLLPDEIDRAVAGGDLAAVAGVPAEVAAALSESLGESAMAFARASNERAPVVLRVNVARTDRDRLALQLADRGIATDASPVSVHALRVRGRANVEGTPEFRGGLFEVQDDASQAVAALVAEGGPVLDFCAGAGGKSLALAARGCTVTAADVRPAALAELERRAARGGHRIATARLEGTGPLPLSWRGKFPVVLVDAPCSGTGVWRRHPELRSRAGDAAAYADEQVAIAVRASAAVAPGGTLVLATCSVLAIEGERAIERVLGETGWSRQEPDQRWFPHVHGTDGFFAARIRRPG